MPLTCTIKRRSLQLPTAVLLLEGGVDSTTTGKLDTVLGILTEQGYDRVLVDLTKVDYVSSAGWRSFLRTVHTSADKRIGLLFVGMQPTVKDVFDLLGLEKVIEVHDSVASALRAVGATSTES